MKLFPAKCHERATLKKKKLNDLYLPSAVFIAQVLVGPSKQLKQIIQIEHNIVKNPNWPEANQLAIYKLGRGFELGPTEKQIPEVARAGLEPGTAALRVRHADHSATLPPIAKTMTANGKHFTFPLEILTAVARHLSIK